MIKAAIDRKTIRAPFAGVTGIRTVNVGQYLNSGDPVVPLQSMSSLYVNFSVPQHRVGGRITAINPVVDDATRNVQVQATFQNPHGQLRPGMYVTLKVSLGERDAVVALPASAISYAPYGNSVFIVEDIKGPDGKSFRGVRQQFVKLGATRGDLVAVVDGVKPGQEVVSTGVFKLRSGAAVVVNNKVQPGASANPKPEDS